MAEGPISKTTVSILAVMTAALTLGVAVIALMQTQTERQERQEDQRRAVRLEVQNRVREQARICALHDGRMDELETRYAVIEASHGILLRNLDDCAKSKDEGDALLCKGAVCALSEWVSGGNARCEDIVTEALQLKSTLRRARTAAQLDECRLPASAMLLQGG